MNHIEPTEESLAAWEVWLAERPEAVREVARRLPPYKLFKMKSAGLYVTIDSYDEELSGKVSLKVYVNHRFNDFLLFERCVFGVDPEDLAEADDYNKDKS